MLPRALLLSMRVAPRCLGPPQRLPSRHNDGMFPKVGTDGAG
jgi:hypothetical protein